MIPSEYKGRPQAFVKHELLKAYLECLFMIIGKRYPVISYIDCFAGPWTEGTESLDATSISLSLRIMRKCSETLAKMGYNVRFRALYIEKDPVAYAKLESYLAEHGQQIETASFHGEFHHLRHKILEWSGNSGFAFFFIDPWGWKDIIEVSTLEPLLKRPNSEYLVNFMLDFLRRTLHQQLFEKQMKEIFGEVPQTEDLSVAEKEALLVKLYQTRLKSIQPPSSGKPRSVTVPILYPVKDRSMYHLVYLTHHPLGIVKFIEASKKLDLVQRKVHEQAKQEKRIAATGQGELFVAHEHVPEKDGRVALDEVKEYWLKILSVRPQLFGIEKLADILEETGWFESDFQQAFGELQREGKVENLDAPRPRRTRFVHFEANRQKGERLQKVKS
jgi:three-Cys-motif partner protein